MRRFLILSLVSAFAAAPTPYVWANPHDGDPHLAFDVLVKDVAGPLVEEAQRLTTQARQSIEKNSKLLTENHGERIKPEELSETTVALRRVRQLSRRLSAFAETAGADFGRRYIELDDAHRGVVAACGRLPSARAYLDRCRAIIARSQASRMQELDQIKRMIQMDQWEQAEARLEKTLHQIDGLVIFMPSQEFQPIYAPYEETSVLVQQQMDVIRRQQAIEKLTALRDSQKPNWEGLLGEIDAAARSVQTQGTALVEGQTLDGPTLVTRFGEQWKEQQNAALRCRAAGWALAAVPGSTSAGDVAPAAVDSIDTEYAQVTERIVPAILRIVESDAGRVSGAEAESLYQAYLEALAPLANHVAGEQFKTAAQAALDRLAAKTPGLGERVAAYRVATDELLRWRRRAAEAMAKAQEANFPAAAERFVRATQAQDAYKGLFASPNPDAPHAQLFASAPTVVRWAAGKLLDQPVTVPAVTAVGAGKSGVSRFDRRVYATAALTPLPPEHVAALARDLLAESTPPLSLAAAAALDSARRGDLAAAGGTIRAFHLESVLARFGHLPQAAWVLCPLGRLPSEPKSNDLRAHVLMRMDVTPRWVRHEYFFASLPGA